MPVAGAIVSHTGGSEQDTTDAEGRFELFAEAGLHPVYGVFPDVYIRGSRLYISFSARTETDIEFYSMAGRKIMDFGTLIFEQGRHEVDCSHFFPAGSGTASGFLRIRTGNSTRVFRILQFSTGDGTEISLGSSVSAPLAKSTAAAQSGQIDVTKELLEDTTVDFAARDEDVGDIILRYPERITGVGAPPVYGAEVLFDGTRESLDANWQMWQSPWRIDQGLSATPVTWEMVDDPVDDGQVVSTIVTHDRKWYGREEIVTKKDYHDFQVHVEFNLAPGANSGVYLQNRYEIQVTDGGGVGHLYGEVDRTSDEYTGANNWNAYDITFRSARWDGDTRTKKAMLTMWWNGVRVHQNIEADSTHGMNFYGEEDQWFVPGGEPLGPSDQGLKFQNHGLIVRYRNIWILELDIEEEDTDFGY
jgi:hypothetical protein